MMGKLRETAKAAAKDELEPARSGPLTPHAIGEQVQRILRAAQETATEIVGQAHLEADRRLLEAEDRLATTERSVERAREEARSIADQRAIVDRDRTLVEGRRAEAERRWVELGATMASLTAWRESFIASLEDFNTQIELIRLHIREIPELLKSAFGPLAEAAASTDERIKILLRDWAAPPVPDSSLWVTEHADGRRDWPGEKGIVEHLGSKGLAGEPSTGMPLGEE